VRKRILEHGGNEVIGWTIWLWPNVLVEAEFHSVWKNHDGELIDITPKQNEEEKILFLPDEKKQYEGRQVDNIRMALRDDAVVNDFIKLAKNRYEIMNLGERAGQHGMVSIPAEKIHPNIEMGMFLERMLHEKIRAIDLCPCGSGRKYKRCHHLTVNALTST